VEIDGWYHFREPQGYRSDRAKDVLLQRAGFFVMRFLAEDVEDRLALIIDEIAIGLGGRRAACPS
jgi:very-short-patch-repair endonuclease